MSIESDLAKKVAEITAPNLKYYRYALIGTLILLLILGGAVYYAYQKNIVHEAKLQRAAVLTAQQAADINVLQNELKISKQNAENLAAAIAEAKEGQRQPEVKYIVQAPTVQTAADKVADQINNNDKTLPPVALEKTDRTVVTVNNQKTPQANWDVGIFKVNNYRNWEWSAGYGQHRREGYIALGLQRNYSKDKAIEAEAHQDISNIKKNVGWEVKAIWKTDKLLYFF